MAVNPTPARRDPKGLRPLSHRQERYVNGILRGLSRGKAAREAGYQKSYARFSRIEKAPNVKVALAQAHSALRETTMYGVTEAVREIDRALIFSYERKAPMSIAKLLELKAKLHGLLVDKVEVVQVSLVGALDEAKRRAFEREPPALVHGGIQDLTGEKGKQTPESPREPNAWREQTAFED